ncbi:long-chain-fatty-acid--CoA ligase [Amycolatopsis panacis]|uniref:Long-chain-fatty-acid--CoA ligase n=1 Tax=Amycolatopsis panacis TaxID=2340917 RepID=A0A419HYZ5_9PSEU|nr:long-chain fatty acid--CoA ligase [Amycolatopsis panacis]RJQ82468.1 long-chain-fatty-acid--CoA ligase [Amycolatopsis panacis]
MTFNLATILRESAAATPDQPLLHTSRSTITYAEVDRRSARVAAALRARGLKTGHTVAVMLGNTPEFVVSYFGILRAGLTMMPLNPQLTVREIAYHLRDSGARLVITSDTGLTAVRQAVDEVGPIPIYAVSDGALPEGSVPFASLEQFEPTADIHPTASDDTAVLLYTSGTTGEPKGAELTHFQLYMNCSVGGALMGFTPQDVTTSVLPLFHVFGLSALLNATVRYGASTILIERFAPEEVLGALDRHGATVFAGVPTMFSALLHASDGRRGLGRVRTAISGGASMPAEVIRSFEAAFPGTTVLEGYGLSETASTTTFNVSPAERRFGSIGRPIWGVEVAIVDQDDHPIGPGPDHVGEIVVRGHNVMKGYYRRPEATASAVREGWFHTGDLGYRDADGYFYVVDRLKDLIIRGGYNVYPREIEEVLYEIPGVAQAAVVGRADARLGEEIVAFVAAAPGVSLDATAVQQHCRERLAAYKCPRQIRLLKSLPLGATGKILKRKLRERENGTGESAMADDGGRESHSGL